MVACPRFLCLIDMLLCHYVSIYLQNAYLPFCLPIRQLTTWLQAPWLCGNPYTESLCLDHRWFIKTSLTYMKTNNTQPNRISPALHSVHLHGSRATPSNSLSMSFHAALSTSRPRYTGKGFRLNLDWETHSRTRCRLARVIATVRRTVIGARISVEYGAYR